MPSQGREGRATTGNVCLFGETPQVFTDGEGIGGSALTSSATVGEGPAISGKEGDSRAPLSRVGERSSGL